MRKNISLSNLFVIIVATGVIVFSCATKPYVYEPDLESVSRKEAGVTWQEQLKYAQSIPKTRANDDVSFSLVRYASRGKIESESEIPAIFDELFSDDASMVIYGMTPDFEIVPVSTAKQHRSEEWFVTLKAELEADIKIGTELIDLEWEHNGKSYYSLGIADNDKGGFLYDNIGQLIAGPTVNEIE